MGKRVICAITLAQTISGAAGLAASDNIIHSNLNLVRDRTAGGFICRSGKADSKKDNEMQETFK